MKNTNTAFFLDFTSAGVCIYASIYKIVFLVKLLPEEQVIKYAGNGPASPGVPNFTISIDFGTFQISY